MSDKQPTSHTLTEWAALLMAENNPMGESLHQYARAWESEVARLSEELAANATMLARQCDLARVAETEVARMTALVTYEQERNASNVAMADIAIKETCERAFNAGMARAIGSHEDFRQIHPTFAEWWARQKK